MSTPKTTRVWAKPEDYAELARLAGSDVKKAGGSKKFLEPSKFQVKLNGQLLNFNYETLDVAIYILSK